MNTDGELQVARALRAAEGYAELGMREDAFEELERVSSDFTGHPDVLRMRLHVSMLLRSWQHALEPGRVLCGMEPESANNFIQLAFALHELHMTAEAKQVLLEGPASLLQQPIYFYNMACYDAILGNVEEAQAQLKTALKMDPKFRDFAFNDPDLAEIRDLL